MIERLEQAQEDIQRLCRQHHVRRLMAFGSAVSGDFSDTSDVDFLVDFEPDLPPVEMADAYFSLKVSLETLLGRSVELVTPHALSNPWFRQGVEETQALLYAA